ncbi:MAG: hypothetical protein HQL67_00270 [Magnetococcales bacterium]|nr:hypothetical protein [Magnetococcales bacterium]
MSNTQRDKSAVKALEPADSPQSSGSDLTPELTDLTKTSIQEMVRLLLPALATQVIQEEIEKIHQEERDHPFELDQNALTAAVHRAFASQIESLTREMIQNSINQQLPAVAEQLVQAEIERIKLGG